MSHDPALDNELAAYTDRLVAQGEVAQAPENLADLAQVVRDLHRLVTPPPDSAFQAQLAQRLNREWNLSHQRKSGQFARWRSRRLTRLVAVAAGVAMILLAVALVSLSAKEGSSTLEGTALESSAGLAGAIVVLVGVGLAAFWFARRHQ